MDPRSPAPLVTISTCGTRVDGLLRVAALQSAGLDATLASDDAGGLHPEMAAAYCGAYRVVVPAAQEGEARELLEELDAGHHAIVEEPEAPRVGLDGRRRGWAWLAVAMVGLFLVYRLIDSAVSFGWF